jgi:uncharacterized OsmC-like protein
MATTIELSYEGGLRSRAVHGPSGAAITIDAPPDNHGRGEFFSPTDLLATALGACLLTLMGIAAGPRGIDLAGATAHVEKQMVADPRRRVGTLVVTVTVPRPTTDAQRRILEAAARTCPVMESLSERVEKILAFRWTDPAGGASPA